MWKVIKLVSKVFFLPDLAIADARVSEYFPISPYIVNCNGLSTVCLVKPDFFLCSMVWSILLSFSPEISSSTALLLDQKLVAIQNPLTWMRIKSNLKPDSKELQVGNDNDNGEDNDDDTNPLFCIWF
ncbi:hypothetical protein D8674_013101 [Pyrus ussuriensis x Pyrus communis]|uniref:Uncharacterized protein n=1 Tax=Pyrus ussuriensis x Pyrus communis TaxID=2448454 RepID=A0A5N5GU79_9ROSA|nr:hypothetical protein D8674_013101 [Pyrus ussuriensis x Pyrus communis]